MLLRCDGRPMSELNEFSDLIGDIYDASLDPALWPPVFEQICRFVNCSSAHLFAQDSVLHIPSCCGAFICRATVSARTARPLQRFRRHAV